LTDTLGYLLTWNLHRKDSGDTGIDIVPDCVYSGDTGIDMVPDCASASMREIPGFGNGLEIRIPGLVSL